MKHLALKKQFHSFKGQFHQYINTLQLKKRLVLFGTFFEIKHLIFFYHGWNFWTTYFSEPVPADDKSSCETGDAVVSFLNVTKKQHKDVKMQRNAYGCYY